MHPILRILIAGLAASAFLIAASDPMPLWTGVAPGEQPGPGDEHDTSTPTSGNPGGKPVIRLGGVIRPTLQVFSPPAGKNSGAAVLVFPGGGYNILAFDLEGTEICAWLNSIGITGILVKYRVPPHPGAVRYAAPLQDAQRALRLTRAHAKDWNIDAARVGVLGFSAGGHLAATTSTNYETDSYPATDEADKLSAKPDFTVLIYPAYLTVNPQSDQLAPEIKVNSSAPQAFLVQAENDTNYVNSSIYYYVALKNAKVPAELHLFAKGGHGYGLRPTADPVTEWLALAEKWFHTAGILR